MLELKASEIKNYLQHRDVSLAVRRMLDLSLESNSNSLMDAAIAWSQKQSAATEAEGYAPSFINEGYALVEQAMQLSSLPVFNPQPLLKAQAITQQYTSGTFSMKPVDITVNTGQITGLVGENGNGKTTLLRCLAGQLAIDAGQIEYCKLNQPDYYAIKQHVAFIPQRIPRWYGRLKDNLHFSAAISGYRGSQNEKMVAFMLERLGLTRYAQLGWEQISSGYRTRFELARILLQKPQLLILDEPLANLDINAQQTILTDLQFIARSTYAPMGIILSSQQLHEVEKIADDVLFIRNGQTVINAKVKTGDNTAANIIEVETTAGREALAQVLQHYRVSIRYNGGFYSISSVHTEATVLLAALVNAAVPISYYRDITNSAKRFFN